MYSPTGYFATIRYSRRVPGTQRIANTKAILPVVSFGPLGEAQVCNPKGYLVSVEAHSIALSGGLNFEVHPAEEE